MQFREFKTVKKTAKNFCFLHLVQKKTRVSSSAWEIFGKRARARSSILDRQVFILIVEAVDCFFLLFRKIYFTKPPYAYALRVMSGAPSIF